MASRSVVNSSSTTTVVPDDHLAHHRLQSRDPSLSKMNTEFFALPGLPPLSGDGLIGGSSDRNSRQMCSDANWGASNCLQDDFTVTNKTFGSGGADHHLNDGLGGVLNRNSWVIPMLALAAVNVIMIVTFEAYVVCKAARNTPSRRHLFLGQMLLLGLLLGSLLGFAYAMEPSELSCAAIRFGTGLAYALIYSSLLVKLVFLISLNTGVYLPATYQALLFLFCLIVQVVIGVQWLSTSGPLCSFSTRDHLLSLLYVVFLILFSTTLAVKSRHFRDNYREAKYIGGLMAISLPIWFAWVLASIVLHESFHPACVGFGLLSCCAVTFVIMFLPKSRQLSAIGKEGIYLEDQEADRFSLHSDRYSPSFYHFKPHKTVLQSPLQQHQQMAQQGGSMYKEARPESPYFRAGNSYTGFHRPLRVVPPSATPSNGQTPRSHNTPLSSSTQHSVPSHPPPPLPPPPYTTRTSYFPSHFFPEKMYQYWQYYYPTVPGIYSRADVESMNIYTSLHEQDRTKSVNPNVYFYKTNNFHPGFIY